MLEHPGVELQLLIREKGLTQKAFSSILGKKVSEVNELLKGKRNITIQWDYLLHQTLGTPIKYRILKQVDYDYSLIDVDEPSNNNKESFGIQVTSPEEHENFHEDKPQESPIKQKTNKENEDIKQRAQIFRSF